MFDSIWKRTWTALRYIFKRSCRFGYWACTDVTGQQATTLRDALDRYIKRRDEYFDDLVKKKKTIARLNNFSACIPRQPCRSLHVQWINTD